MSEDLEIIKDLLASAARRTELADARIDRIELDHERAMLRMERLEYAQNRTQDQIDDLRGAIAELATEVGRVMISIEHMAQQAETDRLEFRSNMQQLLQALTERFNGNGGG